MNTVSSPYAFTGRFPVFRNRIVSDIWLCSPEEGNPNAIKIRALWDTGCSNTIISKRIADFLELPIDGSIPFRSPFGHAKLCNMTQGKVCIVLGAARLMLNVGIDEKPNTDLDCDITLGLDFMTQGDFAITHDGEQLVLSFCYPPISYPTDFTLLAPTFSATKVETEVCDINESKAVERRRRKMIMLDYYEEAAKAKKARDAKAAEDAKEK